MKRKGQRAPRAGSRRGASPAPPAAAPKGASAPKPAALAIAEAPTSPAAGVRTDRWQHLVSGAFHLDEASPEQLRAEARQYLLSVLEVFPGGLDPLEDFEGYAVRRMAGALVRALEPPQR